MHLQHSFRLLKHFMVPESHHAKSRASEIARSLEVLEQPLRVLPAVELNHQTRSHADEVHDVPAERHLPAESVAAELSVAHEAPQDAVRRRLNFCAGRVRSRALRAWRKISLTLPSPASGRGESARQSATPEL